MRYSPLYYYYGYPVEIVDGSEPGTVGSDGLGLNQDEDDILVSEPYYYYYEDELVEVVLYIRTHAESNSRILRKDYDTSPQIAATASVLVSSLHEDRRFLKPHR